jgi:hypothetical protein
MRLVSVNAQTRTQAGASGLGEKLGTCWDTEMLTIAESGFPTDACAHGNCDCQIGMLGMHTLRERNDELRNSARK